MGFIFMLSGNIIFVTPALKVTLSNLKRRQEVYSNVNWIIMYEFIKIMESVKIQNSKPVVSVQVL